MTGRIGVIGVGLMGHGIALNLLRAGLPLSVLAHRNRQPIDDLVARGALEAATIEDLGRGSDAVLLCLPSSREVEAVVDRMEPALRPGTLIIDVTTADPTSTRNLGERLAARSIDLVDAPVTRGPDMAAAGRLIALVGATDQAFAKATPILDAYCEVVIRMGPLAAGHTAKLLNNLVTQTYAAVIAQAYIAARAAGVEWSALYAAMSRGAAKSGTLEKMIPPALEGDFRGHAFALRNALKDIRYARDLLTSLGYPAALADAVAKTFEGPVNADGGDRWVSELLSPDLDPKANGRPTN